MPTVTLKFTKPRCAGYQIAIEPGLIGRAGAEVARRFPGHTPFVLSSPTVWGLHGAALARSFSRAGLGEPARHLIPDGERHKTFANYHKALQALAAFGQGGKRRPLVVLLGGGVLGDMGGFAAATYKRGVPFVQVPTTLLAMVDSSVGGKLGIDFATPRGVIKNLVGAFAQPARVLVDPEVLATLPPREVRAGLAEAVKTAALFDPALFAWMEANTARLRAAEPKAVGRLVAACAAHKARVVQRDEFDTGGERALLNLGHTFGHGLESAAGLSWRHGEAVAWGLCCAVDLARALGVSRHASLARVEPLVAALGLPTHAPKADPARVLRAMSEDKKFMGDMRFILPRRLGLARVDKVTDAAAVESVVRARCTAPATA